MSPDNTLDQHVVTAVVVTHDGAGWIPRMAEGVLQQTRPVQRAVAVDTGSQDRSGAMLAGLFGRAAVFGMDRGTGYAAAVTHALRHRAANTHVPGAGERTEWVWLIHDDCEPAADALERLLRAANETPSAAILGPKVMDWSDKRVILEAGVAIDAAGRRVTGLEPREVDQGQHDGDRDVLAVSTAGMLIRRDVWDQLGGFDTGMRLFREDVDFCWRAQAAGHRVRLVTGAVVYHLEASARNRRQTSAAPRPRREDRRNALTMLAGNLPGGAMLRMLAGNTVLSVLRTMFYLVAKRPGAGGDEFTALLSVAAHPLRVRSARRPRARGRRSSYGRLRAMMPPARTLGRMFEFIAAALSKSSPVDTIGSHHATEDPSDDDSLLVDSGFAQRILTSPGVLLFLALTVVTLLAERSVLGGGPLGGGDLTPAWGGASGLWQEYLQGFHPVGVGSAASTPPYVAVIAFLATLLLGKTWLAVDLLLIGSVPLAGLTAYLAAGRITRFPPARVWAAAAYALLPVGMGAVAAGRLAAAVVFALLPVIAALAARVFTQPRRRARRAAWAMALVTAVAAAFVPLVWLAVAAVVGLGGLIFARSRPGIGLNLAIVAAVPPALLLPWSLQLATSPAMLFLESGLQQPGLSQSALPARSLLLLSPGGPGLPPYWVTGGLLAAALVAALASGRRPAVMAGWGVALAGLLAAIGVSQLVITPPGGQAVPAWPGPMLAFAGAGLVLAVAAAGDSLRDRLGEGRWRSPAGLGVVLVALVACSAPLLGAATWVMSGVSGPLTRAAGPVLPEFVSVASADGMQPRTLVLEPGARGAVSYEVLRGADPLIGEPGLTPVPAANRALATTVADLVAPSGGEAQDQGRALAGFGIGYVLLPSPGSPTMARLLDGVAGLRPVSQTARFQLWRVSGTVARVRVIEPGGRTVAVPSGPVGTPGAAAPTAGGELVLAEPAGGWSASLNGQPLTPLAPVGGWAQAFRLPAGGGTLTVGHSQLGRDALVLLQCLAVLAVAALGLPGARVAGEEAREAADSRPAGSRTRARTDSRPAGRRSRAGQAVPEPRAAGPEETGDRLAGQTAAAGLLAADPGQGPAAGDRGHAAARDTAAASREYPVGGGLAPLPAAGGPAGGGRSGARGRRGPAADAPGRRSGGLLGRARPGRGTQDEATASGTGPAGEGTRSGRGRRGRPDDGYGGSGYPGDPYGSGSYPAEGGGRRASADSGAYAGDGDYGTGGPAAGEYPGSGYPGGQSGGGGYGTGGYGTGGYSTGSYSTGGYDTGSYGTGDHATGGHGTGGHGTSGYGTGGYSTGGYSAGEYRDDDARGRGRAGRSGDRGGTGQGRSGRRGRGGGGQGSDSRGSDSRGGRVLGRRGRGGDGQGGEGRGRGSRGRASQDRASQDRASRSGSREDYGTGGYGPGEYPASGYPAGDYRTGEFSAGGSTGGYPAGDYGSGGYRSGGADGGGYGTGGSRAGDYPGGGYPAGGYPAGDYRTGEYDAGRYETGGYPAGDYGTGGYGTGGYGTGGYGTGGYGDGSYGDNGYGDGDTAGAGGGRKRGPGGRGKPGRGKPSRGKPGRRPGRGDR